MKATAIMRSRARQAQEPEFRQWFGPVDTGMELVSKGDDHRLIEIHQALVDLIVELDPKQQVHSRL